MKTSKKILAIVCAVALVLALSVTAFAATVNKVDGVTGPASITVTLPEIGEGYTAENTYKIYKVFDAGLAGTGETDGINYTLVPGKTTVPDGFQLDSAGNVKYVRSENATELTQTDINAIKAYVNESDLVATVTTTASDTSFTVTGLPYGYYYITTTTGSCVTVNSTHPNATVQDKNVLPPVDKKITGASSYDEDGKKALAEVGSVVEYEASITVEKGAENYVFHDKMSDGLSYNNDLTVYVNGVEVAPSTTAEPTYTVSSTTADTIVVTFDNEYIKTLEPVGDAAHGATVVFKYSATVTSGALQDDPANNTAYLSYGHTPGENHTPPVNTEVYNARINIKKTDDNETNPKPLEGAGFVLKDKTSGKYYSIDSTGKLVWVDNIANAKENFSDANGDVTPFTGLANGTYVLIETTAPDGYNVAADQEFTITEHNYTASNLVKSANVTDSKGPELPSTGGIGTTIFYIVGSLLLLAAAIVLIARRRTAADVA